MKKRTLLLILLMFSFSANAADILKDFDNLGGNKDLLEDAKALSPEKTVSVVQNRIVDRRNRLEFSALYGIQAGGDPYVDTRNVGGQLEFHLTPKFSIGGRYLSSYNKLSAEGDSLIWKANKIPDVDHQKSMALGTITWYPLYGKINLFDKAVTHFDLYATAGGGQVTLKSGGASTVVGGGGIAFWFSQHISSRIEGLYQTYTAKYYDGSRKLDITNVNFSLGFLL